MKNMETLAKEIMTVDLLTLKVTDTVESAVQLLVNKRITGLPVVDDAGKMIGIVSEFDLLKQLGTAVETDPTIFKKPIEFSKEIKAIAETAPLSEVIRYFIESRYRRLPVCDDAGKLVGIITRRDLMRLYYYRARLKDL